MKPTACFDLPGNILILTGSPGAGKSTPARSVVEASSGPAVHLHSDDFWHFIRKGAISPYRPEAHKQNEIVMAVLANAAEGYAKVAISSCGRNRRAMVHSSVSKPEQPLHYIVLRPALDAAIEHCRLRTGDTLTDPEPISALHKQFSMLGEFENHLIDAAGRSPDKTFAAVHAGLVSCRCRPGANT